MNNIFLFSSYRDSSLGSHSSCPVNQSQSNNTIHSLTHSMQENKDKKKGKRKVNRINNKKEIMKQSTSLPGYLTWRVKIILLRKPV